MLQAHRYQEHHENPNIDLLGDVGDKHVCRVCLKLFTRSSDVKAHILRVHCGDRRYPCTMCGKRFKESTHLRKHLKTHTGKFLAILYIWDKESFFRLHAMVQSQKIIFPKILFYFFQYGTERILKIFHFWENSWFFWKLPLWRLKTGDFTT